MANEKTGRYPIEESKTDEIAKCMQSIVDKMSTLQKQQRDELEKDFDELRILIDNKIAEK